MEVSRNYYYYFNSPNYKIRYNLRFFKVRLIKKKCVYLTINDIEYDIAGSIIIKFI